MLCCCIRACSLSALCRSTHTGQSCGGLLKIKQKKNQSGDEVPTAYLKVEYRVRMLNLCCLLNM